MHTCQTRNETKQGTSCDHFHKPIKPPNNPYNNSPSCFRPSLGNLLLVDAEATHQVSHPELTIPGSDFGGFGLYSEAPRVLGLRVWNGLGLGLPPNIEVILG